MTRRGLIHDEGPALGYEAALEAILSLVGRRVDVTVMSADPLGVVGEFAGELTRGDDVRPPSRAAGGEAFRFAVGTENSFSVEARLFREAGWVFSTHQSEASGSTSTRRCSSSTPRNKARRPTHDRRDLRPDRGPRGRGTQLRYDWMRERAKQRVEARVAARLLLTEDNGALTTRLEARSRFRPRQAYHRACSRT